MNAKTIIPNSPTQELSQPINDYQWPIITQDTIDRVVHWLKNNHLSEYEEEDGPLRAFESSFANYHGVNFALLKSSGTSALFSAYHAIWIRPWDVVFVPAFTFVATTSPLLFLWAKIVMIDCNEQGNMCPIDLERNLQEYTWVKCVVVTHNWWIPVEMDKIIDLQKQFWYKLIEDCARSPWAEYKWSRVWTFGDIWCFSFQEKKAVFGWEGGMIITNDRSLYEKMILIWHYFRSKSNIHIQDEDLQVFGETGFWMNFSIHPLSVAIATESFANLDSLLDLRLRAWNFLIQYIKEKWVKWLVPQDVPEYCTRNGLYHFVFNFKHEYFWENLDRASYVAWLRKIWVDVRISDNKPLYQFPLFQKKWLDYFWIQWSDVVRKEKYNADSYFDAMITVPPITDLNILKIYVDKIADFEQLNR